MRTIIFILLIFLTGNFLNAQAITCSAENRNAVKAKILEIRGIAQTDRGDELVAIGKSFLGTPYVAQTLEGGAEETLVVTLLGLDCTTFVENVLAFSLIKKEPDPDFDDFVKALEQLRYRDGNLNGYGSRLHYFSEWISNNEAKGLVKNITASLGGAEVVKDLNFMSQHRNLYPAMAGEPVFQDIADTETLISKEPLCVLSQEMLSENEGAIRSGDILALATSIDGLDVTHTGFAIRLEDNRIHLLHASSSGAVEISALPLVEYLKKIKKNTGIIVARPVF
jgi:hypothetical protein